MNITIELLTAGRQQVKSPAEICLGYREIYQSDGDQRGVEIIPLEGRVWVTQPEDPEDYVLCTGERFTITRPGRVIVQALSPARFRLKGCKI